jgi:hypothetical protein
MLAPKNALDFSKLPPKTIWNMNQKESISVKTKPRITFDKSASKFMVEAFGKKVSKSGYIVEDSDCQITSRTKCGICKKDIHIKHFAGIIKNIGLVCDDINCLRTIADLVETFKIFENDKTKK